MKKHDLDTPALCLDLFKFEANVARMAAACRKHGVAWRPHAKCHKSIAIAQRLIAAGAIGMTCAKLGEAEVFASAGIRDLLIANLVVGPAKLERLVALSQIADPIVCVDHIDQVVPLGAALASAGLNLRVLVEVEIGMNRVGVEPGEPTLRLARQVSNTPGLQLAGVMGYEGHLLLIDDVDRKAREIQAAIRMLTDSAERLRRDGLPCPIVSCGGTGSQMVTLDCPGITECQAGGAIFMDQFYRDKCHVADFDLALTVLTTVVGRPTAERAIIDAGRKTLNMELALPRVAGREGITIDNLSAEHGLLRLAPSAQDLRIGQRLELIPGYSDLTTMLHDRFHVFRGDEFETVWPLDARGRLQ